MSLSGLPRYRLRSVASPADSGFYSSAQIGHKTFVEHDHHHIRHGEIFVAYRASIISLGDERGVFGRELSHTTTRLIISLGACARSRAYYLP